MTSWACSVGSGLKDIFYSNAHSDIFWRSELRLLAEELTSRTVEKIDVSSAKIFTFEVILSERSLMYIKKERGPGIEPWRTPALTLVHSDDWPLKGLFEIFFLKNFPLDLKDRQKYPLTQIWIIKPYARLCQKLLKILRKLP